MFGLLFPALALLSQLIPHSSASCALSVLLQLSLELNYILYDVLLLGLS